MAHIVHPRPQPGRQKAFGQIVFHDGHADFDLSGNPHLEAALRQHGYTIEDVSESDSAQRPSKGSKRSNELNGADTPQETPAPSISGPSTPDALAALADLAPGGVHPTPHPFVGYGTDNGPEAFIPLNPEV